MERIGHWEHVIVEGFWNLAEKFVPNIRQRKEEAAETAVEIGVVSDPKAREGGDGWGVGEAQKRNKQSDASEYRLLIQNQSTLMLTRLSLLQPSGRS